MDKDRCPLCGDGYTLVLEAYEGCDEKVYEPVWCGTCHAWHENVYVGGAFAERDVYDRNGYIGTETNLDWED